MCLPPTHLILQLCSEWATAAVKTNYGQFPDSVHAFVGSVALAGADAHLWSIRGGNKLLAEKLLEHTQTRLVKGKVTIPYRKQHFVVVS